jgi:branched-chain amino acid transport system substrate-binding protein
VRPAPTAARSVAIALLAGLSAVAAAGCGGIGGQGAAADPSQTLTIYSSLPLQSGDHDRQQSIVNGEKLALSQAGGRIGPFHVSFASLDDADPTRGTWTPEIVSQAARQAAQDKSTIAYLGDFDSGATAISLPLVNEAGILQISPGSTYVGLTRVAAEAGKGEPDRYYPSGLRTFARLMPSDSLEAAAILRYMRALGVQRLFVLSDLDVFDSAIASTLARVAPKRGIKLAGRAEVDTRSRTATAADYATTAAKVAAAAPDAVLVGASPAGGAQALWQALHDAAPGVKLFAPSALATPAFVAATGPAADATYVTSPVLQSRFYPPAARRVFREYRAAFGVAATPYALYGYEAMRGALAAIRSAGRHGSDRRSVVKAFFRAQQRDSVLGRYSLKPDGDVTGTPFAGYRVRGGRLVFDRLLRR